LWTKDKFRIFEFELNRSQHFWPHLWPDVCIFCATFTSRSNSIRGMMAKYLQILQMGSILRKCEKNWLPKFYFLLRFFFVLKSNWFFVFVFPLRFGAYHTPQYILVPKIVYFDILRLLFHLTTISLRLVAETAGFVSFFFNFWDFFFNFFNFFTMRVLLSWNNFNSR
jgi:hypothetical protein